MSMPEAARGWIRHDVLALPEDGKRHELVDGELLVSPSPSWPHQCVVGEFFSRLHTYLREQRVGVAGTSPADLEVKSGQLMQPDVYVTPLTATGRRPGSWDEFGAPLLVVEVLSPSTARYDRITKRLRYQRSGVGEYWAVDVYARAIERWTPHDARPEVLDEQITWHPPGASEPLVIDLEDFFRSGMPG